MTAAGNRAAAPTLREIRAAMRETFGVYEVDWFCDYAAEGNYESGTPFKPVAKQE